MADLVYFPEGLRPLAAFSYSHSGNNIAQSDIAGGMSRNTLRYCKQSVFFDITVVMKTRYEMQVFNDFYFNVIEQGTRKFIMKLRPTGPLEEHVCQISPGSISVTGGSSTAAPYTVTMTVEAEEINAPFEGDLYLLYAAGYSNIQRFFNRIEKFANEDLV